MNPETKKSSLCHFRSLCVLSCPFFLELWTRDNPPPPTPPLPRAEYERVYGWISFWWSFGGVWERYSSSFLPSVPSVTGKAHTAVGWLVRPGHHLCQQALTDNVVKYQLQWMLNIKNNNFFNSGGFRLFSSPKIRRICYHMGIHSGGGGTSDFLWNVSRNDDDDEMRFPGATPGSSRRRTTTRRESGTRSFRL